MVDTILRCRSCGIRFLQTAAAGRHGQTGATAAPLCPGCRALARLTRRHHGCVKWYNPRKGFGFVAHDDGSEVFVHVSDLADPAWRKLRQGQQVSYRLTHTDKGLRAVDVQLRDPPGDQGQSGSGE